MDLRGFAKFSLVDYPGKIAAIVFSGGCNLRCPFCHNPCLVLDPTSQPRVTEREFFKFLDSRRNLLEGVVVSGGEPTLQVDEVLVTMLKQEGFYVAIETNGTGRVPENVDWVTLSPKSCFVSHAPALVTIKVNEVKVVFDGIHDPQAYGQLGDNLYLNLQPCDTGDANKNREVTRQCVEYIKQHPQWHLSLQTHKLISIP